MFRTRYPFAICGVAILVVAAAISDRSQIPAAALKEIKAVEMEIDRIEAESLNMARSAGARSLSADHAAGQGNLLRPEPFGEAQRVLRLLPHAGSRVHGTGQRAQPHDWGVPGSVRTRFSGRRPQSHTYASYAPVLHYNAEQGDFVGGQFWDMRATGCDWTAHWRNRRKALRLNPVEMGLIDPACMVYRMSQRPYRSMAEKLWGAQAFAISWPANASEGVRSPRAALRRRTHCRFTSKRSTGESHRLRSIKSPRRSRRSKVHPR